MGTGLAKSLFEHPLIFGLYAGNYKPLATTDKRPTVWRSGENLPSYIPSANFALALMDIAARGPANPGAAPSTAGASAAGTSLSLAQIRAHVGEIGNPQVQRALLTAIDSAQGDFDRARANIEAWYDSSMDRVSGWYKRSTQWVLFWIALVIAAGLNVNTITIADYLYRHDAERTALVSTIDKTAASRRPASPIKRRKMSSGSFACRWAGVTGGARRERMRSASEPRTNGSERRPRASRHPNALGLPGSPGSHECVAGHARTHTRLDIHGFRSHARRAILVRCPQPDHGDPLHGEAPREERRGSLTRSTIDTPIPTASHICRGGSARSHRAIGSNERSSTVTAGQPPSRGPPLPPEITTCSRRG